MISLSILDYSPVDEGASPEEALHQTTRLAKTAERLGYKRFWVSEHHAVPSVAGSAPELLMMHLAANTSAIRIGSGGSLLPNYSPYRIAENFRMLEALHPGRIDLGIGSAAGGGRLAAKALQGGKPKTPHDDQVADLLGYLRGTLPDGHPYRKLTVSPEVPRHPEVWMLGAGGSSAEIAAAQGLPLAFAHFARPAAGPETARKYRENFVPSDFSQEPAVLPAVFVITAETADQAEMLAKAFDLWLYFVETPNSPPYYPSVETALQRGVSGRERDKIKRNRSRVIIGDSLQVKEQLTELASSYDTDEVLVMPHIAGFTNREKAISLLARAFQTA
ncbi:LLM class flavin-dependent oxidoreductase [Indiicoccus explosivorum]|uniref:LLM class flavin-dependent oxidoreductase n=1 Tax=Indiicoccus explosivorum TaxID=1917864 RepID=UPI000B42D115|nr:LLM class flavin-dependent oxidoreductase [Indiicoccus explosivorum]